MPAGDLRKRLIFAAWAIPLGWWLINSRISIVPSRLPGLAPGIGAGRILVGELTIIIVVFVACSEYLRMLRIIYRRNGFWIIYPWLGFQFLSYLVPSISLSAHLDTYGLLILVAAEAFMWGKATRSKWHRASLLFSGVVFIYLAGISLLSLYQEPFQTMFSAGVAHAMLSQPGILTVCAAVFGCDTVAYFAGNRWGHRRLTSISPGKTVEGSVAGLLTATILGSAGWIFFAVETVPVWLGVSMGLLIGVFAQAGDLLVSLMKRYFRVKDVSDMIPGHGGVLDRFDSLFFTAPVLNLFFLLIEKIYGLT